MSVNNDLFDVERKGFYFAKVELPVLFDEFISGHAKLVYTILSAYADVKSGTCNPSVATLGNLCNLKKSSIHNALNELQGQLKYILQNGKNRYALGKTVEELKDYPDMTIDELARLERLQKHVPPQYIEVQNRFINGEQRSNLYIIKPNYERKNKPVSQLIVKPKEKSHDLTCQCDGSGWIHDSESRTTLMCLCNPLYQKDK